MLDFILLYEFRICWLAKSRLTRLTAKFVLLTILLYCLTTNFSIKLAGSVLAQEAVPTPIQQPSLTPTPTPILASRTVFKDDFSKGFEKWQLLSGDWQFWDYISNEENSYAVANVFKSFTVTKLISKDQFWHESWKNYQYELWFEPLSGTDRNLMWGYLSADNCYSIHFVSSYFRLVHVFDGQKPINYLQRYALKNGIRHLKLRHNAGHIQVYIDDQLITEAFDPDWAWLGGGKIVLIVGTGVSYPTKIKFYDVKVSLLGDFILDVDRQTQIDKSWTDDSYDSDEDWTAELGIGRWGCALTSLTMIMNYYDLDKMPNNGGGVNPKTVNKWLKDQKDGYVGEGMLNWQAAMRLVRKINNEYSTEQKPLTNLEMSWGKASADNLVKAIDQLVLGRPVIGHVPGHFFVIDGFNAKQDDLFIKDPAFDYGLLSEHSNEIDSLRLLTPSQTDLSYFLLVYPANFKITLFNQNGIELSGNVTDETINSYPPANGASNNSNHLLTHYFAKPENDVYRMQVEIADSGTNMLNANSSDYDFSFYAYDQEANVQIFNPNGNMADGYIWQFDYSKELGVNNFEIIPTEPGGGSLGNICIWQDELPGDENLSVWRLLLKNLLLSADVRKIYLYRYLDRLACYAQYSENENNVERYSALLGSLLVEHQAKFTPAGLEQLQAKLVEAESLNKN